MRVVGIAGMEGVADRLEAGAKVLEFGSLRIGYELIYCKRKTLGISVNPQGEVVVRAPEGAVGSAILERLRKRADWIRRQQEYFAGLAPAETPRRYVTGETIVYWGRNMRLRVSLGKRGMVRYAGNWLEVECKKPEHARGLVERWLRDQVKRNLSRMMEPWLRRFEDVHGVRPEGVYVQSMEKRWGSCTAAGRILINPELVRYPKGCLTYVLVHELCHLVEPGHGVRFWALLEREMGDYEKWRRRLEGR